MPATVDSANNEAEYRGYSADIWRSMSRTLAVYRRSFADTPPLRLAAAGTGGVLHSMAVFGGVNVIRGVYAEKINFGGHGGVLGGHGVGRGRAARLRPHTRRSLAECTISQIM